jgi:hypothetical protein
MVRTGRVRWTLGGLALLALVGAIWVASWPERDKSSHGPAAEREVASDSQGPVLEGRADTGLATTTATATRADGLSATLRVLAPDGRAAAGAAITCRAFDVLVDAVQGTTDPDGVLRLAPVFAGRRCQVAVEAGASWAAQTFDVWTEGEVTLRLPGGCAVWFELDPADAGRLGQVLRFHSSHTRLSKAILANRTFLGRFTGELNVSTLGDTWAAYSLKHLLLPSSGEITVRWEAKPKAQLDPCWLRVRGPEGSSGALAVALSETDDFTGATEVAARRSEPGAVVLGVAPGTVMILATSGGSWASGQVEAKGSDEPMDVPLTWTNGCALEVRLPVEPSGEVELNVRRMPGRQHDFGGWSESLGMTPGSITFMPDVAQFPGGAWPEATRRPRPTLCVWEGLPRGAEVRVIVPTERWGTLHVDTTIPLEGDRSVLEVPAGARFSVHAGATGAPNPEVWSWVFLSSGAAERTRTVGGSAVVTGLAPGASIRVRMLDECWTGDVMATVEDGAEIRVPLTRRPTARYRARVLDEVGRPLARVGVSFGPDSDVGTTVLSDADGWAEAVTASDCNVMASTAHPGLVSERMLVAAGGMATLTARRQRSVRVVFEIGEQMVEVSESWRGGSDNPGRVDRRRVFPGSTYEAVGLPGSTHLHVQVRTRPPAEARTLFDEELELGDEATTTLRVTR